MPTAVEYAVMLASPAHASTAIEYGLTNPAQAQGKIEYDGNPWHGQPLVSDGYTWSSAWHAQGKVEIYPTPASQDWQLVAVFAAALLVVVAIMIAVRRRFASR